MKTYKVLNQVRGVVVWQGEASSPDAVLKVLKKMRKDGTLLQTSGHGDSFTIEETH